MIDVPGSHAYTHVVSGCIRPEKKDFNARLSIIYTRVAALVEKYQPNEVAIEQVFMHKYADAALKLGHARAAAILAVAKVLVLAEYAPRQVKQAVAGYGAADKSQVQQMVKWLLRLPALPKTDAADALAIAICHANTRAFERKIRS